MTMVFVIQRVKKASVAVENETISRIGQGLLVLLGIAHDDSEDDVFWCAKKMVQLRIFDDEYGIMNLNVKQIGGEILLVSQFTLQAGIKKGNRPSYLEAAPQELAKPIYAQTIKAVEEVLKKPIQTGRFGASMQVSLINDGPATFSIDTKNKH